MQPGWAKIKDAAEYSGISVRTMRDWLKNGLKHSRLPSGTILIKREWIDDFLTRFEVAENEAERITNQVMEGI